MRREARLPIVAAAYVPPVLAAVVFEGHELVEVRRHRVGGRKRSRDTIGKRLQRLSDDVAPHAVVMDASITVALDRATRQIAVPKTAQTPLPMAATKVGQKIPKVARFVRAVRGEGARRIFDRAEAAVLRACLVGIEYLGEVGTGTRPQALGSS